MKKTEAGIIVEIKPVEVNMTTIRIRGTAPLIVHSWSHKAKQEIIDKQTGKTKVAKKAYKNPVEDFIESLYWIEGKPTEYTEYAFEDSVESGARWGFPVTAIKQAAASASIRNDIGIPMTKIRGAFFIEGTGPDMIAEIKGSKPHIREDMVRVGGMTKSADIRYRAQFDEWYMDLAIKYNKNGPISLEQIATLIDLGGFTCGIGEWRPEKDGQYGTYVVEAIGAEG